MATTTRDEFDQLAASIMGDEFALTRKKLAETNMCGGMKSIAAAIQRGDLAEVSVSPKIRVVTRDALAAYFRKLNDRGEE